jgi:hypothetical protein
VVTIEMDMTFVEELDDDEVEMATGAIKTSAAEDAGLDEDYVEATMTLQETAGRRHLLNIAYKIEIVITIPAADLEGTDDVTLALVASVETMTSTENLEALTSTITSSPDVVAINGGVEPPATVTDVTTVDAVYVPDDSSEEGNFLLVGIGLGCAAFLLIGATASRKRVQRMFIRESNAADVGIGTFGYKNDTTGVVKSVDIAGEIGISEFHEQFEAIVEI